LFVWRFPVRLWADPQVAAGSLAAVLLTLYFVDCLLNAFPNSIYMTLAGGLIALEPKQFRRIATRRGGKVTSQAGGIERRAAAVSAIASGPGPHGGQIMQADRYRALGRSFKQEGQWNEAESAWWQALEMLTNLLDAKPGSPELERLWCDCANDLAWLRANHPDPSQRKPDAAVAMARRMVEQFPDTEVYWNTLGAAYYRAGDDASAVAALDRAKSLSGSTAFDEVFLAMAHARLGELEEARTELARAVERTELDYPGHPELTVFCDEARSILDQGSGTPASVH
jgi:tetratricopeptide (TPR) repeat protein